MIVGDQFVEFWTPSHWRREYGYYDPKVYTKGYHRAQDIAGGDWGNRGVPALRAGRVVDTGFGVAIGYWVAVQVSRNRVDGYCHLYGPGRPARGTDLDRGDSVSRLAHKNESPGSAWSGEHLHFIVTDSAGGVPNASAWDTDPRPIILAELASTASGGAKPFEPELELPRETDEDMPINFFDESTGLSYTMTPGVCVAAHVNGFGGLLSQYVNSGDWAPSESKPDRVAAGERVLTGDYVKWMLPLYGFARPGFALPAPGGVAWSDAFEVARNAAGGGVDLEAVKIAASDGAELGAGKAINGATATIRAAET